jgi:hypothetical protein
MLDLRARATGSRKLHTSRAALNFRLDENYGSLTFAAGFDQLHALPV